MNFTNYNALSEVGKITYPASTGESVSYGYDSDGNLTSAAYAGSVGGLSGSDGWTPNAANLVGSSTGIGGVSSPTDSYDAYGRISEATNPGSSAPYDQYGYNSDGTIASDAPHGQSTVSYSYSNSPSDELTQVTNPNLPSASQVSSYSYTSDGQRCFTAVYSASRTLTCGGTAPSGSTAYASYGWNSYGELCWSGVTTTTSAGSSTCPTSAPSGTTSYTYDGNGLRMTASNSSGTKDFDWDLVSASSTPVAISDGTNSYVYGPLLFGGTAPVEQISSSGIASFIASTPTGVQAVFTGTTLSEEAAYSTYGTQVIQSGSQATPFGFQGSYTDPAPSAGLTGLDYLIGRYYDPSSGQFLSVDPDLSQTGQPYAYTGDDPLNATDPSGQRTVCGPDNCGSGPGSGVAQAPNGSVGCSQNCGGYPAGCYSGCGSAGPVSGALPANVPPPGGTTDDPVSSVPIKEEGPSTVIFRSTELTVSVQPDFTITGPESIGYCTFVSAGGVECQYGSFSETISANGTWEASLGSRGVEVAPDELSYTTSKPLNLGPDRADVDLTVTGQVHPQSPDLAPEEVVASVVTGLIALGSGAAWVWNNTCGGALAPVC